MLFHILTESRHYTIEPLCEEAEDILSAAYGETVHLTHRVELDSRLELEEFLADFDFEEDTDVSFN